MKSFQNKVVVITGAGSGMGRELALQLSALGANVALNDWNAEMLAQTLKAVEAASGKGMAVAFDVGDREAVTSFAEAVVAQYGQVDVVVNNAGIAMERRSIANTPMEEFERVVRVNLWGVIYGTLAFLPHLKTRPEAAVVNISSIFGIIGYGGQGAYSTTKFGVRGFTETLRQELHGTSVTVTCVHPGGVKTGIIRNIPGEPSAAKDKFASNFEKIARTTAADAATTIIRGIQNKRPRVLIGNDARLMDAVARLFPTFYERILLRKNRLPER
ncbi:MAG: SDR family oxidoreductase [Saprospiraceae bacterium]|nr:SDR family oxidoreductase [Saprospiraceae bacterium]